MDLELIVRVENETAGGNDALQGESAPIFVPYLLVVIVATIVGTVGNIMIIATVTTTRALRTTGNVFICNLAVADLCVSGFLNMFNIVGVFEGEFWFTERPALCVMVGIMCDLSCFTSLYSILAVSVNRYVHIVHHEKYARIYTRVNTGLIVMLAWTVAFMLDLTNILGWGGHGFDKKSLTCLWDRTANFGHVLFIIFVGIGIPLVLIGVFYILIFLHVRAVKKRVGQVLKIQVGVAAKNMKKAAKSKENSMKLAKTLFIIYICFFCCWAPYGVLCLFDFNDEYPQEIHMYLMLLAHVNSSVNCVLYGVTNKQFRDGYARILGFRRCFARYFDNPQNSSVIRTGNLTRTTAA